MGTKQYDGATDLITFSRNSKGTALRKISYGNELVTNGTFDTDATGWVNGAGSTTTFIQTGGVIQITPSGGNARVNTQSAITLEVGKTYTFTAECTQKDAENASFIHLGITSGNAEVKNNIGLNEPAGVYSHTFVATNSSLFIQLGATPTSVSVSYDNISVKEVTFDQAGGTLELFNHPDDVPRIEYDAAGSVKGLLIEEQRANLLEYSDAQGSSWTKQSATITDLSDNALGVFDGASVASQGSTWNRLSSPLTLVAGTTYAATVWFKKGTASNFRITFRSSTLAAETHVVGDFSSLPSTTNTFAGTASAISQTDLGNDIKKVSFLFVPTSSGSHSLGFGPTTSTAGETAILYGAQVEVGGFPTSYIPTAGQTKTRSADVASIPVSAFGYNSGAGAMFVEAESFGIVSGSTNRFMCINNGSSSERINFFIENNSNLGFIITDNGVTQAIVFSSAASNGTVFKVAGAYHLNDVAFSGNDLTPSVDTSATLPTVTQMQIGNETSLNFLNGHIKSIQYYPRRLTNAQLQELTT